MLSASVIAALLLVFAFAFSRGWLILLTRLAISLICSDTSAFRVLAAQGCARCFGLGYRFGRGAQLVACGCVLRAAFDHVHWRYRRIGRELSGARLTQEAGAHGPTWSMKNADFCADFAVLAKRTLGEDSLSYVIFKLHFLDCCDWKVCARRMRINRGHFFHAVYRIKEKVGAALLGTLPFALYPTDSYFTRYRRASS